MGKKEKAEKEGNPSGGTSEEAHSAAGDRLGVGEGKYIIIHFQLHLPVCEGSRRLRFTLKTK